MKTIYINNKENISRWKAKYIAKKIYKKNKKEETVVVLNNKVKENEELNKFLDYYKIKKLNGKWLFKLLLIDIIEYVSIEKEKQNIAIIMKNQDDIVMDQLFEIAKNVKTLKIISNSIKCFDYYEEKLYEEYGIALQITNNKQKGLVNSNIIINIDFNENDIEKYCINQKAIIINIKENLILNNFKGTNINNYQIEYDKSNFETFKEEEYFDENIIYESYIYRKDNFQNLKNQLKKDKVKLTGLIKQNGKLYLEKIS